MITKDSQICSKCNNGFISPRTGKCISCEAKKHTQIIREELMRTNKRIVLPRQSSVLPKAG